MKKTKPRQICEAKGEKLKFPVAAFDTRASDKNSMRTQVTYVPKMSPIITKNGTQVGWYGWSEKEEAFIMSIVAADGGPAHYVHVFAEDLVNAIGQLLFVD